MSQLIALVATAVMVNGERTVIQPGDALPQLSKHDERELLSAGAAEHPGDKQAQAEADARAVAAANADFDAARQRVAQADESIAAGAGESSKPEPDSSATAPTKAATKTTPARK